MFAEWWHDVSRLWLQRIVSKRASATRISPFQGCADRNRLPFPGRCPGLSGCAPSGQNCREISLLRRGATR